MVLYQTNALIVQAEYKTNHAFDQCLPTQSRQDVCAQIALYSRRDSGAARMACCDLVSAQLFLRKKSKPPDLPDSNQQSKTSSMRLNCPLPFCDGMVMWSMLSLWRSVIPVTPERRSSSAIEPIQTTLEVQVSVPRLDTNDTKRYNISTSPKSSLTHNGMGVPQ